jgi:hypothetical protein
MVVCGGKNRLGRELSSPHSPDDRRSPPSAPSSPLADAGLLSLAPLPLGTSKASASPGDGDNVPAWEGRTHFLEAWLPQGDLLLKNHLVFAFLDNPTVIPDISAFVGAALGSACPNIHVELLPSTRGVKLLRFANSSDRERLRALSPIRFEGSSLTLERPEDTSNRLPAPPNGWLWWPSLTSLWSRGRRPLSVAASRRGLKSWRLTRTIWMAITLAPSNWSCK